MPDTTAEGEFTFTPEPGTTTFSMTSGNPAGQSAPSSEVSLVPSFTNEGLINATENKIELELTQSHTDEYMINSVTGPNSVNCAFSTSFSNSKQLISITGLNYNTQYAFVLSVSYAGNDITYNTASYSTDYGTPEFTAITFKSATTTSVTFELTQKQFHTSAYTIVDVQNNFADPITFNSTFASLKRTITVTGLRDATAYIFVISAESPDGSVSFNVTTQNFSTLSIILTNPAVSSIGSGTATFTFSQNVAEDISYVTKGYLRGMVEGSLVNPTITRNIKTVTMVVSGITNLQKITFKLFNPDGTTELLAFPEITCTPLLSAPSILNTTFNDATGVLSVRFNTTFNPSTTVPPETLRVTLFNSNRVSIGVLNFSVVWASDFLSATITPL